MVAEHVAATQASRNLMNTGTPAPANNFLGVESSQMPHGGEANGTAAGYTNNKRSIITQETDLQISTFQASTMEQRPIFNTSPKLRETPAPPAGQTTSGGAAVDTQAAQSHNHLSLAVGDPTTNQKQSQIEHQKAGGHHLVGTPAIVEAKKVELMASD